MPPASRNVASPSESARQASELLASWRAGELAKADWLALTVQPGGPMGLCASPTRSVRVASSLLSRSPSTLSFSSTLAAAGLDDIWPADLLSSVGPERARARARGASRAYDLAACTPQLRHSTPNTYSPPETRPTQRLSGRMGERTSHKLLRLTGSSAFSQLLPHSLLAGVSPNCST